MSHFGILESQMNTTSIYDLLSAVKCISTIKKSTRNTTLYKKKTLYVLLCDMSCHGTRNPVECEIHTRCSYGFLKCKLNSIWGAPIATRFSKEIRSNLEWNGELCCACLVPFRSCKLIRVNGNEESFKIDIWTYNRMLRHVIVFLAFKGWYLYL